MLVVLLIIAAYACLLYGTGMRLMEGMRLRVKDVDFPRAYPDAPATAHSGASN